MEIGLGASNFCVEKGKFRILRRNFAIWLKLRVPETAVILVIFMHRLFAKRFEFGVAETAGGGGPVGSYSRSSSC